MLLWDVNRKSYALYRMATPNPVFKVMAFLKSNNSEMVHLRVKVTIEH